MQTGVPELLSQLPERAIDLFELLEQAGSPGCVSPYQGDSPKCVRS